jgi:hypothetical protein
MPLDLQHESDAGLQDVQRDDWSVLSEELRHGMRRHQRLRDVTALAAAT